MALVVPEYVAHKGGIATVTDSLLRILAGEIDVEVDVYSLAMSARSSAGRRLTSPPSWLSKSLIRDTAVLGRPVREVGANLSEFELSRYRPRRELTRALQAHDVVQVVAGSPATCVSLRHVSRPVILIAATLVEQERRAALGRAQGVKKARMAVMSRAVRRLDEAGLRIPRHTFVLNDWMRQQCQQRGISSTVWPPGVDVDRFHPAHRRPDGEQGYVLLVGRLRGRRKNVAQLLHAYARARTQHGLRQRLVLAGNLPLSEEDGQLLRTLGIADQVTVKENVDDVSLPGLYASADLFCLTSLEEGLGMVLVEAMASGVPLVATDTRGARQVIGDGRCGTLVSLAEPDLTEALAAAMATYANDPVRRASAGAAGRERAVALFSDDASRSTYLEVLDRVVASTQPT